MNFPQNKNVFPRLMQSGMMLVGVSALLFACKGTIIKFLYAQGATVADIMLLRMLFALPVYGWVAVVRLKKEFHNLSAQYLFGTSLVGIAGYYLASYLDLRGLQTVSVGLERIILYTYPVFVILLSTIFPGKKISLPLCVCIAIIYLGLILVFYADISLQPAMPLLETGKGALFVLSSALAFAVYVIGSDFYMRIFSSALFTSVAMMAAALAMALHYAISSSFVQLLHLSPAVYVGCAVTALVFTVLPSFMMSAGVRQIGSAKAGAIGMIGPVATVLIAGTVLGESVSALQGIGLTVVMVGVHRLHRS
jgi:drug/metabolite transporter (DMT)-like permease